MFFISQDYFDELCIENYEVFDMVCTQEAVQETIKQLRSTTSTSDTICDLRHLTLTYPDEAGLEARKKIRSFCEGLHSLVECASLTDCESQLDSLRNTMLDQKNSLFVDLFLVEDGYSILFSLISRAPKEEWSRAIETLLCTVLELASNSPTNSRIRTSFQTSTHLVAQSLTELLEREVKNNSVCALSRISIIFSIVYASILRCEKNKVLWMSIRTETSEFPSVLLTSMKLCTRRNELIATEIHFIFCQIITSLCTFDDFQMSDDAPMISMQSCHSNALAFLKIGTVSMIHELILTNMEETLCNDLVSAAFLSLRAMAIQDDVVRSMVKVGVIDSAAKVLLQAVDVSHQGLPQEVLVTSLLGFFRNVSANDDVKATLCNGKYRSIVHCMLQAMNIFRTSVLLQEHGCGLIAAMALRKPKNAAALISAGAHMSIVAAMQQHVTSVTLQRQAALAIRNLVSRSPQLRSTVLNECDAEVALRTIAGKHLACQDEVYAALRDLGLEIRSIHLLRSDDGTLTVQESRPMFGERNPTFRPEFTVSEK